MESKMQPTTKRFKEFLDYYGFSNVKMAEELQCHVNTISYLKSGKIKPSDDMLRRIEKAFPKINIKYLERGEGSLLKDDPYQIGERNTLSVSDNLVEYQPIITNAKKAFVKYYEQIELIKKLLTSKQDEFIEVYDALRK